MKAVHSKVRQSISRNYEVKTVTPYFEKKRLIYDLPFKSEIRSFLNLS